jgi:hypothetical protein
MAVSFLPTTDEAPARTVERTVNPWKVEPQAPERQGRWPHQVLPNHPPLTKPASHIRQEDKELTVVMISRRVIGDVNLRQADGNVRNRARHHRDRPADSGEVRYGLVQRCSSSANLNNQFPGQRMLTATGPGCEHPNSYSPKATRQPERERASLLGQEVGRRARSQDNDIFVRVMCRGLVTPRRLRFGHRATVRGSSSSSIRRLREQLGGEGYVNVVTSPPIRD